MRQASRVVEEVGVGVLAGRAKNGFLVMLLIVKACCCGGGGSKAFSKGYWH